MSQTSSNKRQCRREPTPAAPAPPLVPAEAPPPPPPPPPLLDLIEKHPDLFTLEVLARLPHADHTALAGACLVSRDAEFPRSIFPTGLPRAETPGAARGFRILRFVQSVERLAWAKDNGCPWVARTFELDAVGGNLEWARTHDCPWDERACALAAMGGRLELLKWLREHGCLWDERTCAYAATLGYLHILKWAREQDCPWSERNAVCGGRWERAPDGSAVGAEARVSVG
jgi:hypothetical protein